ncbi:cupredoxin domain-containing protein [Corynebacterium haemomassiliense]|uniref:Cupredoxin domain-containing protein n=1 Tax=Corynebacterium haemomassiliense TaxID=2754726 RepID=A0A7W2EC17_9CORY|nr:cupredoxin domain-containing protein [Corynebacterium haemomassiliense]MBA5244899.1 cupredoxin domain-containing protein [Corynebacterium haemomassiliense]
MTRRIQTAAWAIVAAGIIGVASASALTQSQEGELPTGDDVVTADVRIERMRYIPDRIEVPRGTKLVVNLVNDGEKEHDLKIGEANSGRLSPGETSTAYFGEFNKDTRGWCTIAGHKTMGMTFKVDVI